MKLNEIRKTTSSDLNKELVELKQELFKLRFQLATNNGTLENPMRIKNIKTDIARIKTVIRARELGKEE